MSTPEAKAAGAADAAAADAGKLSSKLDRWMDIATGRIAKVTGLVVAVGLLVTTAVNKWSEVTKLVNPPAAPASSAASEGPNATRPSPACLKVTSARFPNGLVYSRKRNDWDGDALVEVSGRNECGPGVGLYLAITATSKMLTLKPPGLGKVTECEKPSLSASACWDYWVPVETQADKTWVWRVRLPPAEPKDDEHMTDGTIRISYQVRRMDDGSVLRGETPHPIPVSIGP